MKKTIAAVVLISMLALASCGQPLPAAEAPQSGELPQSSEAPQPAESAQLANPWRDITEEEARALCPKSFSVPEGAENALWSAMDSAADPSGIPGALVQLCFDLNGLRFTARAQRTDDRQADISGMYYDWTAQDDMILTTRTGEKLAGSCFRFIGEEGYADLCTWYDEEAGVSCSLSVTAKDLDGFDLQAVAEALTAPAAGFLAAYDSVIQTYKAAYEAGNNNFEYVFSKGISEFVVGSGSLSYALRDLDKDGTPELLLADPTCSDPQILFAVYTLADGAPLELAVSQGRDRFYLLSDDRILNEGSGGALYSVVFVLVKSGDALVGTEGVLTYPNADNTDALCYYQAGSTAYEPRPEDTIISDDDFQTKWEAYRNERVTPELTAIL